MRIGPFYFDSKELFLLVAAALIGVATYLDWPLWLFDKESLLVLIVIMLVTKGLLPAIHNENYFILSLVSLFLILYFPLFQVLVFYFFAFVLLKAFRVI